MQDVTRITDYTISPHTLAIFDYQYKGQSSSFILEKNKRLFIKKKPIQLIRESCRHYGLPYRERVRQTKRYFRQAHKLPILLTHTQTKPCILFPLYSARTLENAWLNLYAIRNMKAAGQYCIVQFDDEWIPLPATMNVFKTQYTVANLYARNLELNM
ncbi:MAG: competence protein ComK [Caryophanon sp.]|nr:competence protein ComK [Caryophanon sp.]